MTRDRFANHLGNLALACPSENLHQKRGKNVGEWLSNRNRCWFAGRMVEAKRAGGLTVDRREAAALERVRRRWESTAMKPMVCRAAPEAMGRPRQHSDGTDDALNRYDAYREGRITCKEARPYGIAPVHRLHPTYRYMRNGNGDGVVCE